MFRWILTKMGFGPHEETCNCAACDDDESPQHYGIVRT